MYSESYYKYSHFQKTACGTHAGPWWALNGFWAPLSENWGPEHNAHVLWPRFPFKTLQLSEKLQDTENEAMSKIVELEKQLMQRNKELDVVRVSVLLTAGPDGHCRQGAPALVLVERGIHSCQRNALMQHIYWNHFRSDTQMKSTRN